MRGSSFPKAPASAGAKGEGKRTSAEPKRGDSVQIPERAKEREIGERFIDLAGIIGGDMAIFCLCGALNLPVYIDEAVPTWDAYLNKLKRKKNQESFIDGETDAQTVMARGASEQERWERDWGTGDPDNPYTAKDYKALDSIFRTYSARLDAAGGMDAQQEDTLRYCSSMRLLRDKCIAKGDKDSIEKAAKLDKMIQDGFSAENLRKKDAKPLETARVDGIIDQMQKRYGVGAELTKGQFLEIFYKWCRSKHYPETVDAAEHAMLAIINTMRANNDLPEMPELPKDAKLNGYADEFAREPNEQEQEVYNYLNLTRNDGWTEAGAETKEETEPEQESTPEPMPEPEPDPAPKPKPKRDPKPPKERIALPRLTQEELAELDSAFES